MSAWIPAYVALGSNLDGPREQLAMAVRELSRLPQLAALVVSPQYQSPPLGGLKQPPYVNAVAGFLTMASAPALLAQLLDIETRMGRVRGGERWAPRRIDLDLLVYGDQLIAQPGLTVPHPGIATRGFVLYPLADIAPHLAVPGHGSVQRLRAVVDNTGLKRLDP
jgi:2-amino-4-hydroxy-6-hydroxymethyldihydropteridine diphosphokinase